MAGFLGKPDSMGICHKLNVKTSIEGDSKITSWYEEDGSFGMYISPRMATAQEINDAFVKLAKDNPDVVMGNWSGINWVSP